MQIVPINQSLVYGGVSASSLESRCPVNESPDVAGRLLDSPVKPGNDNVCACVGAGGFGTNYGPEELETFRSRRVDSLIFRDFVSDYTEMALPAADGWVIPNTIARPKSRNIVNVRACAGVGSFGTNNGPEAYRRGRLGSRVSVQHKRRVIPSPHDSAGEVG
jgi:hypothetical protein